MRLDEQYINAHLKAIETFFADKSKKQLISLCDFSASTGLDRNKSILFFSLLSMLPKPPFIPVTIPYALNKSWNSLKVNGIITDKEEFAFRIPSETSDDGWVPVDDIDLILNYEVC